MPVLIFLLFPVLIAIYAVSQGRSFLLWFLISAIFTPFIGLIALLVRCKFSPRKVRYQEQDELKHHQQDQRVIKTIHYPALEKYKR